MISSQPLSKPPTRFVSDTLELEAGAPAGRDLLTNAQPATVLAALDAIHAGTITLFGRRLLTKSGRLIKQRGRRAIPAIEPIPSASLRSGLISWSEGKLYPLKSETWPTAAEWDHLHFQSPIDLSDLPKSEEGQRLLVCLPDAIRLVQEWRERASLSGGWLWGRREFWIKHPELEPRTADTSEKLKQALINGDIVAHLQGMDERIWADSHALLSKEYLDGDPFARIDLRAGRVNLGQERTVFHAQQVGVSHANKMLGRVGVPLFGGPEWYLFTVDFLELRKWAMRTFSLSLLPGEIVPEEAKPSVPVAKISRARARDELFKLLEREEEKPEGSRLKAKGQFAELSGRFPGLSENLFLQIRKEFKNMGWFSWTFERGRPSDPK